MPGHDGQYGGAEARQGATSNPRRRCYGSMSVGLDLMQGIDPHAIAKAAEPSSSWSRAGLPVSLSTVSARSCGT